MGTPVALRSSQDMFWMLMVQAVVFMSLKRNRLKLGKQRMSWKSGRRFTLKEIDIASCVILCVVFWYTPFSHTSTPFHIFCFVTFRFPQDMSDITRFPRLVGGWFFNSWVNSCLSRPSDTAGLHTEKENHTPDIRAVVIWQLVVSLQNWLKIQRRPEEQSAMESPCAKQQLCFANDISLRQKLNHDCPFKMLQDTDHEFQSNAMQPHMKGRYKVSIIYHSNIIYVFSSASKWIPLFHRWQNSETPGLDFPPKQRTVWAEQDICRKVGPWVRSPPWESKSEEKML